MRLALPLSSLLLIALILPSAAPGQDAPSSTPEAVAERALLALQENRIDDFADAMHPEALKGFRKIFVELLDAADDDDQADQLLTLFAGVDSVEALRTLDHHAFFVAFYKGITQVRPELKAVLASAKLETLGHVMEGEDIAHVVYRMSAGFEGIALSKMQVLSLRRTPDGWAMLLSGDIEGVTSALRQRFGKAKPE